MEGACPLTNKRQPNELQPDHRDNRQCHPQRRLTIQREPKEPLIRSIHQFPTRLIRLRRGFEDPVAVSRRRVDFIPPAQPHKPPSRDVLEVVEVAGEEEDGDDEDEDEVGGEEQAEEVY